MIEDTRTATRRRKETKRQGDKKPDETYKSRRAARAARRQLLEELRKEYED